MGGREFLVDAVPAGAQAEISGLLLARSIHEVRIGSKRFSVSSRNARAGWAARSRVRCPWSPFDRSGAFHSVHHLESLVRPKQPFYRPLDR